MRLIRANLRATVLLMLMAIPAIAHTGDLSGGLLGGFAHPLFGPDHVVAMVAVGLWGAFLGPPAMFVLPADLGPLPVEINRLDNQALVRYHDIDWRRWD